MNNKQFHIVGRFPKPWEKAVRHKTKVHWEDSHKPVSVQELPGRNEPCPCGSGKKFKKCHLGT